MPPNRPVSQAPASAISAILPDNTLCRIGVVVQSVGCALLPLIPLAMFLPWQIGVYDHAEQYIVAFHLVVALLTFGLGLNALGGDRRGLAMLRSPVITVLLALSLWGAVSAIFAEFPLLALIGGIGTAMGPLLFIEMAVIVIVGTLLQAERRAAAIIALSTSFIVLAMPILSLWPATRMFFLNWWFGFYAITAPFVVFIFGRIAGFGKWTWPLTALAMLVPVLSSANRTAMAIALIVLPLAWCAEHWRDRLTWRFLPRLIMVVIFVMPLFLLGATLLVGQGHLVASIRSRALLDLTVLAELREHWSIWLIGQGWGRSVLTFFNNLYVTGEPLWRGEWDVPDRLFTDTQNLGIDALSEYRIVDSGIPALLAVLILPALLPLAAAPDRRWIAAGFGLAFATMYSFWYQLPAQLGVTALAFAALQQVPAMPRHERPLRRVLFAPGLFAVSFLFLAIGGGLLRHGLTTGAIARTLLQPEGELPVGLCAQFPMDEWRASLGMSRLIQTVEGNVADHVAAGTITPRDHETLRIAFCMAERGRDSASPWLLWNGLSIRRDLAIMTGFDVFRAEVDYRSGWARQVGRFLAVTDGRRTDMLIPYFIDRMDQGQNAEVLRLAGSILARRPDDPVALLYSGLAMVQEKDPIRVRDGLRRVLAARQHGLESIFRMDPSVWQKTAAALGSESGQDAAGEAMAK